MNGISGFTITQPLAPGRGTTTYRAVADGDQRPLIVKILDARTSRPRDRERLAHEYEIGKLLDTPSAVKPLALETYQGMQALVLEDFGGQSLDALLGRPMAIETFLNLATRIAAALADVHHRGVIHKDLKPQNILFNAATGEVKLSDFGLASRLSREEKPAHAARLIEGSFPYLSPEQTGRTNRVIDSRTDLYSVGVTFYQMLTGRLPFEARDPLEWVHCHVARTPPSPGEVVADVPETVAGIVLKLLSKMPEDRYQSARGLLFDLETCLDRYTHSGRIAPFKLGERDAADRLQFPQRLYGRESEAALLLDAFGRVLATGSPGLVLLSGGAGVGKSVLAQELNKPVTRERGFFVTAKFDQQRRNIPYATLFQAFRALVLEILAENGARGIDWRERLLEALGPAGQLIIDVIPPVELIIGPQRPVADLPPIEAQNRFRTVFRRFIAVFAQPLVLFVDDLQWADVASVALLRDLLVDPEVRHVLVVAAYRENEPGEGSEDLATSERALSATVDAVREVGGGVTNLTIGPIPRDALSAFVAEALHCGAGELQSFSDLVYAKTGGNPFFAIQFLIELHDEGLIELDAHRHLCRWDRRRIYSKGFTDNVVDLMLVKIVRLPDRTREALQRLACLGHTADAATLALATGGSVEKVHTDLWEATRAGLILRAGDTYSFLHDRIQEAAYSLVPEGDRAAVHLEIGRRLVAGLRRTPLDERIFDVVNQLERGLGLVTSRKERERVAGLHLAAAQRAKHSTAYSAALSYATVGSSLLPDDPWKHRYDLAFPLEFERAECEFLTGDLAAADERLTALAKRAVSLVDVAAVTCMRLALYTTLTRLDRGVEACLDYLRRVGVEFAAHPTDADVEREFARAERLRAGRRVEELLHLPVADDEGWRATMDVLAESVSSALFTDQNLLCLIVLEMVNISLERGNSDASSFAYSWYGWLLGPRFGDYRKGARFGQLALDLTAAKDLLRFKARVYLNFGYFSCSWGTGIHSDKGWVRRGLETAQEQGDLTFASYCRNCLVTLQLAAGDPLRDVRREAERALELTRKAKFGLVVDILTGQLRLIRKLQGPAADFSAPGEDRFDEEAFERRLEAEPGLAIASCWYWTRKLQASFFEGDYATAVAAEVRAQRFAWTSPWFFEIAELHFYGALARAAHYDQAPEVDRPGHLEALLDHHRQLETWAKGSPDNFENRASLVGAEIARIRGESERAEELYEKAIAAARKSGFVHNEAIAHEAAARFYRARGFELISDTYLERARANYLRWGAGAKALELERQYPQLAEPRSFAPAATVTIRAEQLDLISVAKASQTISGEIVRDKLVRRLLEVVLEQGGARRAYLILYQADGLSVEAEAALEEGASPTSRLCSQSMASAPRIPASLIAFAHRTSERVILSDATKDAGEFARDEAFVRYRPKSVLCLPIRRQATVVGLLYLENDLLAGVFTPDRLVALELLATQAAISLENALLMSKERTARAAAEAAEHRSAVLAEVGSMLSESLDYERALEQLARLCVRTLADSCVIDVVNDREIQRLAGALADPSKQEIVRELQRRYPVRWDSPQPAATVLRTGRTLFFPDLPDAELRAKCIDDEHFRLVRDAGVRAVLSVPLAARGQMLGAVTLCWNRPNPHYGQADLELIEDVARRAATLIDNARLYLASQEAVRTRSEFLSVASHELNTPLTSLMLAIQHIRHAAAGSPTEHPAIEKQLELLSRQGTRLTRLVNDLLDVSRLEAGRPSLQFTEVDLGTLVREVVARFDADIARSRCTVSIAIQSDRPIKGRWDRSLIDRVVTNLLSNALKFGPGEPIEVAVDVDQANARLSIRDHGIGIEPGGLRRIFHRFERAASSRNYGGLGLGLYISRQIVEEHGGTIRCESRVGLGSTFFVELPCSPAG